MKKCLLILLLLLSLTAAALGESGEPPVLVDRIADPGAAFSFPEGAELLQIIFPNVWDEDAELILCGGEAILIDCAKEQHGNRVVALLEQLGVTELKCVINSHPHNDHILGLKAIAKAVTIGELYFCFPEKETKHMPVAIQTADKYGIPVVWYEDGHQFKVGGAVLDVWLKGDDDWTLNERSAQMRLQFGDRTMLFTGDMMQKTQKRLMEVISPELLDIDIFKYPHHGLSLPDDAFMEMISPEYVIITNTAGERTKKVRSYLTKQKIPYATTVPGYISLTTDGTTWVIERLDMASD